MIYIVSIYEKRCEFDISNELNKIFKYYNKIPWNFLSDKSDNISFMIPDKQVALFIKLISFYHNEWFFMLFEKFMVKGKLTIDEIWN